MISCILTMISPDEKKTQFAKTVAKSNTNSCRMSFNTAIMIIDVLLAMECL